MAFAQIKNARESQDQRDQNGDQDGNQNKDVQNVIP